MLIRSLPTVRAFLDNLNESLAALHPSARLSLYQTTTLVVMMMGIIISGTLNWAAFGRGTLKKHKPSQLRWMFYCAKIRWDLLLQASVMRVLAHYGVTSGTLAIDDTSKKRTKKTTRIAGAHKIKDKATGGYLNGQELVFMILITDRVTFPVSFRFYTPDPSISAWNKENKKLKENGVPAKQRPKPPAPDHEHYPTKSALALAMLREFVDAFPAIKIKGVLADALYGDGQFMDEAATTQEGIQVVSQLRGNQIVSTKNSTTTLENYFSRQQGVVIPLSIRGGTTQQVTLLGARLKVQAHDKRRFIVALKYEGEASYRYLVASDLSWRHIDIAQLYSLRWLVEVFIQDWKAHGGWNRLAKQQGEEGSTRGVILSLLCDHLLLLHPEQSARLKNKQPGMPVGCLIEHLKVEALVDAIQDVVTSDNPKTSLDQLVVSLKDCLPIRPSKKHMAGRNLGRQEPTPSLLYQMKKAA
jgi:hypothetical protein